jgi:glycosyltransferase involved in cell wall biosynthesis
MDYNIRAARAGFRGVWACSAYVHRSQPSARRVVEESRCFEASKRRYQDKFCAPRLRGEKPAYEVHCRGDECEHFAPTALIQIRQPLSAFHTPRPASVMESPTPDLPLVSCIMATRGRRDFVLQSVRYFLQQDYPARELLILDDDTQDLSSELSDDPHIRYLRLPPGLSIGAKRNRGCELARGTFIAHWDDDDWYAPTRLSAQVVPLSSGTANICALSAGTFFDLDHWQFWKCGPELHRRMFVHNVHGGTLMFHRSLFDRGLRYPNLSLAEDAWFLHYAVQRGAQLHRISGDALFVYLRHRDSTWQFSCGDFIDPSGWLRVPEPDLLRGDRDFYFQHYTGAKNACRTVSDPLVSCIMPTANRRAIVPQAIKYFLQQDYPRRELLILDDGRESVADVVPHDSRIRYIRMEGKRSLGAKRNLACELSEGEIILHWDDDDWMSNRRLSYQVCSLLEQPHKDVCGLSRLFFYDPTQNKAWVYIHPSRARAWISGNTLCYRKSLWQRQRFPDINEGEDTLFVWRLNEKQMLSLDDPNFYVATVHPNNTSIKHTHHPGWQSVPPEKVRRLLGKDVVVYDQWVQTGSS